jgi:hypothetical protein
MIGGMDELKDDPPMDKLDKESGPNIEPSDLMMSPDTSQFDKRSSIRGPLRYEVTISSPQIEAGRPFSVFVRITNPYDVPAEIIGLNTPCPVEFQDLDTLRRLAEKEALSKRLHETIREQIRRTATRTPKEVLTESGKKVQQAGRVVLSILPIALSLTGFGSLATAAGSLVARSVRATSLNEPEEKNLLVEDLLSPEDIESIAKLAENDSPAAIYQIAAKQLRERLNALENSRKQAVAVLQPSNSIVQIFTLCTTRSILFSPSTYNLHIQSEYKIDGATNQDTVDYQLNIRAPLHALIIGSFIGSVSGFLLRSIFDQGSIQSLIENPSASTIISWIVALIGNILLGAIVVVAFARKKDAQPILAIEDFWGGVLVGVLAGYSGKSFLDQFIKSMTVKS